MAILRSDLVRPDVNLLLHSGFCPSLRIYVWFDAYYISRFQSCQLFGTPVVLAGLCSFPHLTLVWGTVDCLRNK